MAIPSQANNFKTRSYWACVETRSQALGQHRDEGIVQTVGKTNLQIYRRTAVNPEIEQQLNLRLT